MCWQLVKKRQKKDVWKFELLAFTETKLKGKGEVSWSGVNVIFTGVHEMERAKEGVTERRRERLKGV